jgi:kinase-associated protein B
VFSRFSYRIFFIKTSDFSASSTILGCFTERFTSSSSIYPSNIYPFQWCTIKQKICYSEKERRVHMTEQTLQPGDMVTASYKSGEYIGELVELYPPRVAVVKILAVLKHPEQGDLHHPFAVNVPLFHQRRALAYQEKASAPLTSFRPYTGEVPEYTASLRQALEKEITKLKEDGSEWGKRCLVELEALQKEYFPS